MTRKKRLLFLSWRDIHHPKKGGAELFTHEMLKRAVHAGYEIVHFSPMFDGAKEEERIDGVLYKREGSLTTVIHYARKYYRANTFDFVVDQCNTHRFLTKFWVPSNQRVFFIHQLTREIWFYNSKFPVNVIGYLLEPLLLKLNKNDLTMTVSNSTRENLLDLGFQRQKVKVLPEGLDFEPWSKEMFYEKEASPTFVYVGRMVPYKGIDDALKAFIEVKKNLPDAKLWIIGKPDMQYVQTVLGEISNQAHLTIGNANENKDVTLFGFVNEEEKLQYMSRAHALLFPSLREGWGLTISEAAVVGTPSIVYNTYGVKDAVDNGKAGYLVPKKDIKALSQTMLSIIRNPHEYEIKRQQAYDFSKRLHWNHTGNEFINFMRELS
ncbi:MULTISPECIES: glycosyltransferase family 4 protein [Lysinibacillus]|uniref:Glycosyltransferase family 1 protein n=1 Tax=Lysinibacillus antri TaxID=2498145 RepID=A0A3S0P7R7_9BACI|nr:MULTISPECIES: glycosyltransferase family 4 protein [Lysinibacillus]RUL52006.1 glycosyltransferase family 1 protein [Lysinibacillus antri]TSI05939.1 glycosyltransferase family 4 protein [Lysinibacillus sp. BW-2-10]